MVARVTERQAFLGSVQAEIDHLWWTHVICHRLLCACGWSSSSAERAWRHSRTCPDGLSLSLEWFGWRIPLSLIPPLEEER